MGLNEANIPLLQHRETAGRRGVPGGFVRVFGAVGGTLPNGLSSCRAGNVREIGQSCGAENRDSQSGNLSSGE